MASRASSQPIPPFLKWAGGKRWLTSDLIGRFPPFRRYYEPFLGSGALFFALQPRNASLSDVNGSLIETYQAIADNWQLVLQHLQRHAERHSDSYYYELRDAPRFRSKYERAAQFIYLNRTCWNGLYRVNRQGQFNVPRGTKDSVLLPTDDFEAVSNLLRNVSLVAQDFEAAVAQAREGDVIFLDPPYTVAHNTNGFLKYNRKLFSWEDQIRLKSAVDAATARGASVFVCNADHDSVRDLYSNYQTMTLTRTSAISGTPSARKQCSEILIQNC